MGHDLAGTDLATRAELVKLARALGAAPEEVAFAASLDRDDIRRVRERAVGALYDEHRAVFRRIAAITRLLPTPLNVKITLRAFPPLLAARVAGEMTPERAAELADRMPVEYLADSCPHLDPRRAAPLISRMDPDRVLAVVLELVRRDEFVTLGRLLDAATEPILRDATAAICDEALLRIACYTESEAPLSRAVALLPPRRLHDVVTYVLTGPPDLRAAALALLTRLEDDQLRTRLADQVADADDAVLTDLAHTAIDDGTLDELLAVVAAMSGRAKRRVLALPALAAARSAARRTPGSHR